jgi:hypothetical protein
VKFTCEGVAPQSPSGVIEADDWVSAAQDFQLRESLGYVYHLYEGTKREVVRFARVQVTSEDGEVNETITRMYSRHLSRRGGVLPKMPTLLEISNLIRYDGSPESLLEEWDREGGWEGPSLRFP